MTLAAAACTQRLPDPVPVPEPGALVERLQATGTPDKPQLIEFKWRYVGREGRYTGEGGVRLNPPDSVRLDLFGPGWSGVQSAVLVGDDVYYIGEQRIRLPPPTFLWTMLGTFRPPAQGEPAGAMRGEWSELTYRISQRQSVVFRFDAVGRLVEAELLDGREGIQTIRIEPGESEELNGYRWPKEARFRDLVEFYEVQIRVTEARDHDPFESRIFKVVDR